MPNLLLVSSSAKLPYPQQRGWAMLPPIALEFGILSFRGPPTRPKFTRPQPRSLRYGQGCGRRAPASSRIRVRWTSRGDAAAGAWIVRGWGRGDAADATSTRVACRRRGGDVRGSTPRVHGPTPRRVAGTSNVRAVFNCPDVAEIRGIENQVIAAPVANWTLHPRPRRNLLARNPTSTVAAAAEYPRVAAPPPRPACADDPHRRDTEPRYRARPTRATARRRPRPARPPGPAAARSRRTTRCC